MAYFISKKQRTQHVLALDLNDIETEGEFISSTGGKVNFTNWHLKTPNNKTDDLDYATMYSDGLWNVFNGNYSSGVIICQISCPPRK